MRLLDTLERKLRRFAIPNLTLYLVMGQTLFYILAIPRPDILDRIAFIPSQVLEGEVWRLVTFFFFPPSSNLLFAFFAIYFLYLMGTALEGYWGAFRYNLYLLVAYLATIGVGFIAPDYFGTNLFITGSVFLAFAYLYPDFVILLFFILPIKIKWLALLTWAGYILTLAFGDWPVHIYIAASVLNFFLFFGVEIFKRMRYGNRHMIAQAKALAERNKPFHTCAVCGITDRTHPQMDFRYCPDCKGGLGYCTEHIHNHEHKSAATPVA